LGAASRRRTSTEFCGNATREQITQYVADRWQKYPVEVWVMNYPATGRQKAAHSRSSALALATYDAARQGRQQTHLRHRQQSWHDTQLYVAANRKVAGMIIQSPPRCKKLILSRYGWWNYG
jgi:hypothetical protein